LSGLIAIAQSDTTYYKVSCVSQLRVSSLLVFTSHILEDFRYFGGTRGGRWLVERPGGTEWSVGEERFKACLAFGVWTGSGSVVVRASDLCIYDESIVRRGLSSWTAA
jgi:hypothetical protein